jgi:hypothetical protein
MKRGTQHDELKARTFSQFKESDMAIIMIFLQRNV